MTMTTIRLDRSKRFSECRGERTPDDPHYRVHYWQGGKVGNKIVLLPFDAQGELVPPDKARMTSYEGLDVEGKTVMHQPLYNKDMLDMLERKTARLQGPVVDQSADAAVASESGDDDEEDGDTADEVNLVSWLRGEAQYQPHALRAAAKKRYSKNYADIRELVVDLVLDERLVPEDQLSSSLQKYLPAKAA